MRSYRGVKGVVDEVSEVGKYFTYTRGVANICEPQADYVKVTSMEKLDIELEGVRGRYLNVRKVILPLIWNHFSAEDHVTKNLVDWALLPLIGAIVGAGDRKSVV